MKKKLFSIICVSTLFLIVFLSEKGINNRFASDYSSLSAVEVVRLYTNSSIKGDENTVSSLVTKQPASYLEGCKKNENQIVSLESPSNKISVVKDNSDAVINDQLNAPINKNDKFAELAGSQSENQLAFLEARFVWATQSAFKEIKILPGNTYKDEAIVDVQYVDSASNISKRKFFLTNNNGWKVFSTRSLDSLNDGFSEKYARPRPLCEDK